MKVVLAHGFNSDGQRGLFRLRAPLESLGAPVSGVPVPRPDGANTGTTVAEFTYKNRFGIVEDLLRVRLRNDDRARRLARLCWELHEPGQELVLGTHSNGALLAVLAARLGAPIDRIVMFNPALSSTFELPAQVRRCDVFACRHDLAILFGGVLPFHPWGWLGREGYRGNDPRIITWRTADGTVARGGELAAMHLPDWDARAEVRGHSEILEDWKWPGSWWRPYAVHAITGRTGYWDHEFRSQNAEVRSATSPSAVLQ